MLAPARERRATTARLLESAVAGCMAVQRVLAPRKASETAIIVTAATPARGVSSGRARWHRGKRAIGNGRRRARRLPIRRAGVAIGILARRHRGRTHIFNGVEINAVE